MKNDVEKLKINTQEIIIDILKDSIDDNKHIIRRLQGTIILLICLLVVTFIYYEWSFKAFMSQYDYSNEIITTTNTDTNSDVKNYGSHSNTTNNVNVGVPKNTNENK